MAYILTPTQSQIQTTLRSFLLGILPTGVEAIEGQDNRVAEPKGGDFVVFWAIRRSRIETNFDVGVDVTFIASIVGSTMTVSSVIRGVVTIGQTVFGVGVTVGTVITGSSAQGVYTVAPSQNVSSRQLSTGTEQFTQPTEVTYQVDIHGPNSSNNAEIISTLFRDSYAVGNFVASGVNMMPLYADEPHQIPFLNAEQQYETRWVVEAVMQVNQTVSNVPQEFMDHVYVEPIDVVNEYPLIAPPLSSTTYVALLTA